MENNKNYWKIGVIVTLIFTIGYLAGVGTFISVWYFRVSSFNSMREPTKAMAVLTRELDLNNEQKEQVEKIVNATTQNLFELRDETRPRIRNQLRQAHDEIAALLNDEQRRRFDRLVEKRIIRFMKMRERMLRRGNLMR
jgi:hypothetical protein